jgi:hypothetical protein
MGNRACARLLTKIVYHWAKTWHLGGPTQPTSSAPAGSRESDRLPKSGCEQPPRIPHRGSAGLVRSGEFLQWNMTAGAASRFLLQTREIFCISTVRAPRQRCTPPWCTHPIPSRPTTAFLRDRGTCTVLARHASAPRDGSADYGSTLESRSSVRAVRGRDGRRIENEPDDLG